MKSFCNLTGESFEIHAEDLAFLQRMSPRINGKLYQIPAPTLSPDARMQRRQAWRNERTLYRRKCDLCSRSIISVYREDSPYTVYCHDCWWSDKWEPLSFGREFDFSRSFFEQFSDLLKQVPLLCTAVFKSENCEYNNDVGDCRNCYMCNRTHFCEDCYHCFRGDRCRDCCDCYYISECELVSNSINSSGCFDCDFLFSCSSCHGCQLSYDLLGCSNCCLCSNLRHKEYYFRNKRCSREEYYQRLSGLNLGLAPGLETAYEEFTALIRRSTHPHLSQIQCERCLGDELRESADCFNVFSSQGAKNARYANGLRFVNDCMDIYTSSRAELLYECSSMSNGSYNAIFTCRGKGCSDIAYSLDCFFSRNLFGCISLKTQEFCLLNKKYRTEEFYQFQARVLEHMIISGEFGEFFPVSISPFAYNETAAQEWYPRSKDSVLGQGWSWQEAISETKDTAAEVFARNVAPPYQDIICGSTFTCELSGKHYRITKPELEFWSKKQLPLPRYHPVERHKQRHNLRNSHRLWSSHCAKCQAEILTTFAPELAARVLCEACYLSFI